jgi:VWFA-related protein
MRNRYRVEAIILLTGLLLLARAAPLRCAQSGDQDTSPGPNPDVGPTVLAPKKTQPAPPEPEKKPERINPNEVFTISTASNLVNVDVLVVDKEGNPVSTLNRKNFKLFDDNVEQTITNFGTSQAPTTTCMLVEFSNKYWAYLYVALRYGYSYLQFIQPKDWTAVVEFDMHPEILTDFTQDRSQVRGALDMLRIPGFSETNMYDAVAFALDRMKGIKGRKAIILLCTGFDTFSKLTYDEILKIVKGSDTVIYPISILEFIAVRSPRAEPIGDFQARNALETFARYTGGKAYFPRFEEELPGIYEQINGQLRLQYGLGFAPSNPTKDGKFHKLEVRVVDDQGNPLRIINQKGKVVKYHIVARDGYYAPKS